MALDKLVDSTQLNADLTSVANAIRTKGGTSASLAFPAGFVSAVDAIETGGGGYTIDEIAEATGIAGDIVITVPKISDYAFYGRSITSVELPNQTVLGQWAFRNCSKLTRLHAPKVTKVFNSFAYTKLTVLCLPNLTNIGSSSNNFSTGNPALKTVDIGPNFAGSNTNSYAFQVRDFQNNSGMTVLVLRPNRLIACPNVSTFQGTPFASDGTGGTLYVPQALIASYQAATNWSTILGYANNSIQAIEGSIYETQYADGTPIT